MFILAGNAILIILLFSNSINALSNTKTVKPIIISQNQVNASEILVSNTASPDPSPTPTPIPSPTPTPLPSVAPTINSELTTEKPNTTEKTESNIPAKTSTDIGLDLINQINDFRAGKGLSSLSTDGYTCAFAVLRAGEITSSFNHDGFRSRIDAKTLPYPSYSSVAENIAMNSNPDAVVPGWINSPGHNENMSKNVNFGCVGKSDDYYVFEAWQP